MDPDKSVKAAKAFMAWKNPAKWLIVVVVVIFAAIAFGIHEQKNIREARQAMLAADAPPEPSANAATPDDIEPAPANPGGITLYHIHAIMVSDGGPATIGPAVRVVESQVSSTHDLIQNGHVQNYNSYIESAGRVIQNGDVQNVGGIVRTGSSARDGG